MSTWVRIVVCVALGLLVACGGSSDEPKATDVEETNGTDTDTSGTDAEETPEAAPAYAYADYDFAKVSPKNCKKTEKVGDKAKVTLHAIQVPEGFSYFEADCFTDVRHDQLKVTLINDTTETHNFIVEGDDVELVTPLNEKGSVVVELTNESQLTFQCTFHPAMQGAFFR